MKNGLPPGDGLNFIYRNHSFELYIEVCLSVYLFCPAKCLPLHHYLLRHSGDLSLRTEPSGCDLAYSIELTAEQANSSQMVEKW